MPGGSSASASRGPMIRSRMCVNRPVRVWLPAGRSGWTMQACSSMAERCYHMAEVGGSIPSAPTTDGRISRKTQLTWRRNTVTAGIE